MEAAILPKKKKTISKGKVKRTIKNVLCRPDPVFWPNVSEEHAKILEGSLSNYKIEIPQFKKPHWKELKILPKSQRPKQPKIKKIEGLILGLLECTRALKNRECSAIIVESSINPCCIVQPLIEACISVGVPVLCLNGLRKMSSTFFGIPTSCLGIQNNFSQELINRINHIAKVHKPQPPVLKSIQKSDEMEMEENTEKTTNICTPSEFSYLHRTNKSTRVFNPSSESIRAKKAFIGQDFIEFSNKPEKETKSKAYMNMILKRIGNNQNRVKRK